jgi:hypothetical protein
MLWFFFDRKNFELWFSLSLQQALAWIFVIELGLLILNLDLPLLEQQLVT